MSREEEGKRRQASSLGMTCDVSLRGNSVMRQKDRSATETKLGKGT